MIDIKEQITIAVVGDVHDLWNQEDELALQHLGVDLVLFVGDFGNESVEIVRQIAGVNLPKAVIMGNHDAWYSASSWGRQKAPYDRTKENRVQQQLDLLAYTHVGFSKLDFAQFNLSVVGSRPFSWGGSTWRNQQFYHDYYQVNNFEESTARIVTAAQEAIHNTIIFIGHNGPFGLGDEPGAICGRDWKPAGGDYGDLDFTKAIAKVGNLGKSIPLVTFGHMHHHLKYPPDSRRKIVSLSSDGIIYLNAACVPRVTKGATGTKRNFSLVLLHQGVVQQISLVWLNQEFDIQSSEILFTV